MYANIGIFQSFTNHKHKIMQSTIKHVPFQLCRVTVLKSIRVFKQILKAEIKFKTILNTMKRLFFFKLDKPEFNNNVVCVKAGKC